MRKAERGTSAKLLARDPRAGVLGALLLAAGVHFLWGIGDSSYFVDEVASIEHALPGWAELRELVRTTETTPYGYFILLHGWLHNGGSAAEGAARASSAAAGVLLVAATYWAAEPLLGRRRALAAAGLVVLSPLVLQYAQQVRTYVWLMLAVVVAAGATVRRGRWLWLGAAACVVAIWLHYAALPVVIALCGWVVRQDLPVRSRVAYVAVCLAALVSVLPLLADQYRVQPDGGAIANGALGAESAVRVLGTAFDGRWTNELEWPTALGALVTVVAVGALAQRRQWLLASLCALPLLALLGIGLLGKDLMTTRYSAAAAPFVLMAIAALPRRVLPVAAVVVAAALAGGLVASHGVSGRYAPALEAVDYIAADYRPGDAVVIPAGPGAYVPLVYYGERRLRPPPTFATSLEQVDADRIWIVSEAQDGGEVAAGAAFFLEPLGLRVARGRAFTTATTFGVVLAVRDPQRRG
jgi:4-amino-4-deoxy-L-arabinose transferase-like glycosyltransferase